jgi:hypothetical protein
VTRRADARVRTLAVAWLFDSFSVAQGAGGPWVKVDCNSAAAKSISALLVVALAFVATQFNKML